MEHPDMTKRVDYSTAAGQKKLMAESMGLPSDTYSRTVNTRAPGDHGADPVGDGTFRMVPSGDIVDHAERNRRLAR
jgi:hypothetical protein